MKRFLIISILIFLVTNVIFAGNMVNPLKFKATNKEKEKVLSFIKQYVKRTYSALGMGDAMTLRMMERQELSAFKQLTQVKNHELLNSVKLQYCAIGMCNYGTLLMMYNQQLQSSKQKLEW